MRTALVALMLMMSLSLMGQGITLRVDGPLPAHGVDQNGVRYLVLNMDQDRFALSDVVRALYCDSVVFLQDELLDASEREVSLLMDRLQSKDEVIEKKSKMIAQWELQYLDSQEQVKQQERNVRSLRAHIRRKRWGWWSGVLIGAAGVAVAVAK